MDQTTKQIIRRLANQQPREKIISDLTERFRLTQTDAERLVLKIEETHHRDISKRRRPLLVFLWSVLTLFGLSLLVFVFITTLNDDSILLFQVPTAYLGNILLTALGFLFSWGGARQVLRLTRDGN